MNQKHKLYKKALFIGLILQLFSPVFFSFISAQSSGFNKRIYLDNKGTILRNIQLLDDSLVITGEIGTDLTGLSGYFLLVTDTFGEIGRVNFYRDPSMEDHAFLDGRNPVIINNAGRLIIAGHFFAKDDLFITELYMDGDILLFRDFTSDYYYLVAHGLIEFINEYYIIGTVQTQNYDLDVFIQKIDTNGNKIWEKTYGSPSKDEASRSAIIEDNGLTVMISEAYNPTPTIKNDTRYWIRFMHIDTSGAITKDWKEEVTGYEGWTGSLLKYEDDYIYTTNTIGEETTFSTLVGGQVVRRSSDFNVIWRMPFGLPDNQHNQLGDMIIAADSNLLIAGNIFDPELVLSWARVMKINPDGELIWEARDTGIWRPEIGSSNRLEGIAEIPGGSSFSVGYTYDSQTGHYHGLLFKVTKDGCIDTLCTITDIEDLIRMQEEKILVYPNPVKDELTVQLSKDFSNNTLLRVYDSFGREIFSEYINEDKKSIDVSHLTAGLYILQFSDKEKVIAIRKVIKQ